MTKSGYRKWLDQQVHRQDVVGDLARDVQNDPNDPQNTNQMFDRMVSAGADYHAFRALDVSLAEWLEVTRA